MKFIKIDHFIFFEEKKSDNLNNERWRSRFIIRSITEIKMCNNCNTIAEVLAHVAVVCTRVHASNIRTWSHRQTLITYKTDKMRGYHVIYTNIDPLYADTRWFHCIDYSVCIDHITFLIWKLAFGTETRGMRFQYRTVSYRTVPGRYGIEKKEVGRDGTARYR
jgi:hypothetical protein